METQNEGIKKIISSSYTHIHTHKMSVMQTPEFTAKQNSLQNKYSMSGSTVNAGYHLTLLITAGEEKIINHELC